MPLFLSPTLYHASLAHPSVLALPKEDAMKQEEDEKRKLSVNLQRKYFFKKIFMKCLK